MIKNCDLEQVTTNEKAFKALAFNANIRDPRRRKDPFNVANALPP
jgi:hypothetical protein